MNLGQSINLSGSQENRSLLEFLKTETAPLHQAIESVIPLLKPNLKLAEYRSHLIKMLGFYSPLEASLAQYSLAFGDALGIAQRFKTEWIHADLIALAEPAEHIANAPKCSNIPQITSAPKCVGVLYVIEGSTLGAQVIRRSLIEHLDLDETKLHFYTGYGSETRSMWHSFRLQAQNLVGESEYKESAESAREIFRLLLEWLRAS
jgi:heme oxygenase